MFCLARDKEEEGMARFCSCGDPFIQRRMRNSREHKEGPARTGEMGGHLLADGHFDDTGFLFGFWDKLLGREEEECPDLMQQRPVALLSSRCWCWYQR